MKRIERILLVIFLIIVGNFTIVNAQLVDLKILTFNMQQPFGTNWDGRKANAAQIINTYQGDIIGTQELVNYQRDYIINNCPGYTVYGQGRDCGDNGEGSWILFKTAKFTLDASHSGNFWFSDNYTVCAKGYDPNYNRICTYVRLIDKATGKAFYIFNAHFPTPDQPVARTKSMTLLCERAAARAFINDPVIFTGDFNSLETETQITYIKSGATNPSKMRDTYRELYPTGSVTTGFGVKFDYIFTENKSNVSALATQVITSPVASDHMPLSATIRLNYGTTPPPPAVFYSIPGKVEAENFSGMSGIQIENTTDIGAGSNVGYIDAGDFIEYSLNSTSNDAYDINFRLASLAGGGVFKLQLDGVDIPGLINVSATGGWQTWVNVLKSNVVISSGNHKLRIIVVTGGFNINYLNFSKYTVVPTNGELKVLTQNLWRKNDSWATRRSNIITMIQAQAPDFIAITEGDEGKAPELDNLLTNYSLEKGPWNEESTSILYNQNTLSIVQTGVFGYSSTPDQNTPSNWGDGAVYGWLRKCNWVLFEQIATGKRFYVYNNHLDALNSPLGPAYWRLEEAKLMAARIAARSNPQYPFIVIGDLNEHENGNAIAYLKSGSTNTVQMKDTYREILPNGDGYTFGTTKLDYIFTQKNSSISTLDANIIYQSNYGHLSDHNAIWAKLSLNAAPPTPTPTITLSQSTLIEEGAENGKTIMVTAANGQFVNTLNTSNWTITNLPAGVTKGTITRINNTQVTINLSGNSIIGTYSKNITDVTVTIGAAEFVGGNVAISKNTGITLTQAIPIIPGKIEAENYTTMSGVQVENTTDVGAGKNVGWLDAGDYLDYKMNATATAGYNIAFRVASLAGGGALKIQIDGIDIPGNIAIAATGGWQTWISLTKTNVMISSGVHTVRILVVTGGFNLNHMVFSLYTNQSPIVSITSPVLNAVFNAPATMSINASATDNDGTISSVNFYSGTTLLGSDNSAPYTYTWTNVAVGMYALTAKAIDNNGAEAISSVINIKVEAPLYILIEAEGYSAMLGVQNEPTLDVSGVLNVAYIDAGDWMAYNSITFPTSGFYTIEYRVASVSGGILSSDLNAGAIQLGSLTIPATGGWQNWVTVSQTVNVTAGTYNFGIFAKTGGWNINWFQISKQNPAAIKMDQVTSTEQLLFEANFGFYPNPAVSTLYFNAPYALTEATVQIVDINGGEVFSSVIHEMFVDVSTLQEGLYFLILTSKDMKITRKFVKQ